MKIPKIDQWQRKGMGEGTTIFSGMGRAQLFSVGGGQISPSGGANEDSQNR